MRNTAGTTTATNGTAWDRSPKGRLCHGLAGELGIPLAESEPIVTALFEVLRREGQRIHDNVPVCTNCREAVDKLGWEAGERLDTIHTESADVMLRQAKEDGASFRAELESRGVKI